MEDNSTESINILHYSKHGQMQVVNKNIVRVNT